MIIVRLKYHCTPIIITGELVLAQEKRNYYRLSKTGAKAERTGYSYKDSIFESNQKTIYKPPHKNWWMWVWSTTTIGKTKRFFD